MQTAQLAKWTRTEYDHIIDVGGFPPGKRLQLINGDIIEMSPQSSLHSTAIQLITESLRAAFPPNEYSVRVQLPLCLGTDSEPEPDLAVVRGTARDYRDAHPSSALLVVEVADLTLAFDRGKKKALYAETNVPEYWVLNLMDGWLELFREPAKGVYRYSGVLRPSDIISPLTAPTEQIRVADLMP